MPLQTANEFAAAAVSMSQLAAHIKPADADPYAQPRKLIQYHLLSAANQTRQLAEALAQKEANS